MATLTGINENGIDNLSLELRNLADQVNDILNSIEKNVQESEIFFDCESGKKYREKFSEQRTNINVISQNILTYSNDLVKAKFKTKMQDINVTKQVVENSNTIVSSINKVEVIGGE